MKILVVSHACARAVNQQLYAEIQRQTRWAMTLVVPRDWRDEFGNRVDEPVLEVLNARVLRLPVLFNGSIILHFYRFRWKRFLAAEQFDAIYVHEEPYACSAAQVCWANHSLKRPAAFGFYSAQNMRKHYAFPIRWWEGMVYRNAEYAFPITPAVAEVLAGKGFRGERAVTPLPIDGSMYHPRPNEDRLARVACVERSVVLGYVGRLVAEKGLRTLALALTQMAHLRWQLVVIGSGPFQQDFDDILRGAGLLDRVTHLGFVPHQETPSYLAAMDVLVLPSETQPNWKEQFGRVIPEALACGTAVVGSDSGEIPRLIRESGGGMVFPERDVAALSAALKQMISSPGMREEMAVRGREWVMENLSVATIARRMAEVMERAVTQRRGECAQA